MVTKQELTPGGKLRLKLKCAKSATNTCFDHKTFLTCTSCVHSMHCTAFKYWRKQKSIQSRFSFLTVYTLNCEQCHFAKSVLFPVEGQKDQMFSVLKCLLSVLKTYVLIGLHLLSVDSKTVKILVHSSKLLSVDYCLYVIIYYYKST